MAYRLEDIEGFVAEGDVLGVNRALDEGRRPKLINQFEWQLPDWLVSSSGRAGAGPETLGVTDELVDIRQGFAVLRPPSLFMGLHPARSASSEDILFLTVDVLARFGLARSSVIEIATADEGVNDASLSSLDRTVRRFPLSLLDQVAVPNPSDSLKSIVGSRSVCEAAARLAAGPGGVTVVPKQRTHVGTVSIFRRLPEVVVDVDASRETERNTSRSSV